MKNKTFIALLLALAFLPAYAQKGKGWSKYGYAGQNATAATVEQTTELRQKKQPKTPKQKQPKAEEPRYASADNESRSWFVGGQLAPNIAVADNITDHSFFNSFFDALGLGFEVYGGKFFTPNVGARVGVGYGNVKNRGDHGYVDITRKEAPNGLDLFPGKVYADMFKGSGFYHFGVLDVHADALFDFSGKRARALNRPLHLLGFVGIGLLSTGEKKMYPKAGATPEEVERMLLIVAKKKESVTTLSGRLGLIFDYRVNPRLSVNLEGNMSVTGDKFDGIDYDEPVDFLLKAALGVTYHF